MIISYVKDPTILQRTIVLFELEISTPLKISASGFGSSTLKMLSDLFLKLQGVLMFKDQYRAVMQYSLPRDAGKPSDNGSPRLIHHDWICAKVSNIE